jgi:enoyl-[acyl-carrier protein] reductase II
VLAQEILPHLAKRRSSWPAASAAARRSCPISRWAPAGCQLGTRFVCARESVAHPKFKQAFIRAAARDAMPSVQLDPRFPVIPVRALNNGGTRRFVEFQREVVRAL